MTSLEPLEGSTHWQMTCPPCTPPIQIYLSIRKSIHPPTYLPTYIPMYLPIYLSVHLIYTHTRVFVCGCVAHLPHHTICYTIIILLIYINCLGWVEEQVQSRSWGLEPRLVVNQGSILDLGGGAFCPCYKTEGEQKAPCHIAM